MSKQGELRSTASCGMNPSVSSPAALAPPLAQPTGPLLFMTGALSFFCPANVCPRLSALFGNRWI